MKTANEIMDIMAVYDVLKRSQLDAMFPDGEKEIGYLIKKKRLFSSNDGEYLCPTEIFEPNKPLIVAISVLLNVFSKVKYHAKGTMPAQIFFATDSNDYEIIYVEQGKEAIISSIYNTGGVIKQTDDTTNRWLVIENIGQIEKLKSSIPNVTRFAHVKDNGSIEYLSNVRKGE